MAAKRTKNIAKPRQQAYTPKYEKPIFRAGTWITLVLLLALIGVSYYLNNQKETAAAEATPAGETTFVFDAAQGMPTSIEVKPVDGDAVKVARNTENVWVMELPVKAEANQGIAEQAASQVASLSVVSEVDGDPQIFGVNDPSFIITVEFSNGEKHTLDVGDPTPTNSGYYVWLDQGKIMIVGLSGIDALANLAFFPPYLNTPTPSPLPPTETPVAPIQTPTP